MAVCFILFVFCCVAALVTMPRSEVDMLYYDLDISELQAEEPSGDAEDGEDEEALLSEAPTGEDGTIDVAPQFEDEEASQPKQPPRPGMTVKVRGQAVSSAGKVSRSPDTSSSIRQAAKIHDPVSTASQEMFDSLMRGDTKL